MTVEAAPETRRRRWAVLLAVAIVAAALGWLAFSGIGSALVYYETPSELVARGESGIGRTLRLGGVVQPGSLTCVGGAVDFVITDGDQDIPVRSAPGAAALICPREGVGVVVNGRLSTLGVFEPDEVIIKHDENYVAPTGGAVPSQVIDPGS
ncbi:MAG TPA: cytochrome c maturation protein CcmE [Candidatus Limnocylindria bacterium]|jgi:cytochrome c-type biogenesis protein CcmE|nr:cytochrome c maturation protein CcmE [Candidatus Limnocylindria bacterium]